MTEQLDEDTEISILAWKRLMQTGEIKLSSESGEAAVQNIDKFLKMRDTIKNEIKDGAKRKAIEKVQAIQRQDAEEAKKVDTNPPPEVASNENQLAPSRIATREELQW